MTRFILIIITGLSKIYRSLSEPLRNRGFLQNYRLVKNTCKYFRFFWHNILFPQYNLKTNPNFWHIDCAYILNEKKMNKYKFTLAFNFGKAIIYIDANSHIDAINKFSANKNAESLIQKATSISIQWIIG